MDPQNNACVWKDYHDVSHDAKYWHNDCTNETLWDAECWKKEWDDEANANYWHNKCTGEATWIPKNGGFSKKNKRTNRRATRRVNRRTNKRATRRVNRRASKRINK